MKTIRPMQESDFVNEIVANRALKGFSFENGRVVPVIKLNSDDNDAIASILEKYGINSHQSTQMLSQNLYNLIEKPKQHFIIADIIPGTLIKLLLNAHQQLEIIYLGNYSFCLCKDSTGVLHPLDVLRACTLDIICNEDAYFQVLRNSSPYPSDNKLFKAKIKEIIFFSSQIEGMPVRREYHNPVKSRLQVNAWQASNRPPRFEEEDLTIDDKALFMLDLEHFTFYVNPSLDIRTHIEKYNEMLKVACELNRTNTNERGEFILKENEGKYLFYITKKTKIGI